MSGAISITGSPSSSTITSTDGRPVGYNTTRIPRGKHYVEFGSISQSATLIGDPIWRTELRPWEGQELGEAFITVEEGCTVRLQNIFIKGSRGHGIHVKPGGRLILDRCCIFGSLGSGVWADDDTQVEILRSYIDSNGIRATDCQVRGAGKQDAGTHNPYCVIVDSIICNRGRVMPCFRGQGTTHHTFAIADFFGEGAGNWVHNRPTLLFFGRAQDGNQTSHPMNADVAGLTDGAYCFHAFFTSLYDESWVDTGVDFVQIAYWNVFPRSSTSRGAYVHAADNVYDNTLMGTAAGSAGSAWASRRWEDDASFAGKGVNALSHFGSNDKYDVSSFAQNLRMILPREAAWEADFLGEYPLKISSWSTSDTTLEIYKEGPLYVVEDRVFPPPGGDSTRAWDVYGASNILFRRCEFTGVNTIFNYSTNIQFEDCYEEQASRLQFANSTGYKRNHYINGARQSDVAITI